MAYDHQKELSEAIEAGERALFCLQEASRALKTASNLGWVDLFGGGSIISFLKYNKKEKARQLVEEAQDQMRYFSNEISDVRGAGELEGMGLNLDDFISFADIFLDNPIVDWMAQRRIQDARAQVDAAIDRVSELLARLRSMR